MNDTFSMKVICVKPATLENGLSDLIVGQHYTVIGEIADLFIIRFGELTGYFPKDCFKTLHEVNVFDYIIDVESLLNDFMEVAEAQRSERTVNTIQRVLDILTDLSNEYSEQEEG